MGLPVPVLFIVGFVVVCIGWLLHLIGMATTSWSTAENGGVDFTSGVFRFCTDDNCDDYDDPSSELEAVQAMVIIGILLAIAAIIVSIVHIVVCAMGREPVKLLPIVSGVLSILAFIFIIIGVIVWGADIHDDLSSAWDLGYSFALSIVGAILLLIGGILLMVGNMTSVGAS